MHREFSEILPRIASPSTTVSKTIIQIYLRAIIHLKFSPLQNRGVRRGSYWEYPVARRSLLPDSNSMLYETTVSRIFESIPDVTGCPGAGFACVSGDTYHATTRLHALCSNVASVPLRRRTEVFLVLCEASCTMTLPHFNTQNVKIIFKIQHLSRKFQIRTEHDLARFRSAYLLRIRLPSMSRPLNPPPVTHDTDVLIFSHARTRALTSSHRPSVRFSPVTLR